MNSIPSKQNPGPSITLSTVYRMNENPSIRTMGKNVVKTGHCHVNLDGFSPSSLVDESKSARPTLPNILIQLRITIFTIFIYEYRSYK